MSRTTFNNVPRVNATSICQQIPQGLLQPLPLPDQVWEDLLMDFITHLLALVSHSVIWVLRDRLTKYAHFVALPTQFNAQQLAK